MEPEVKDGKGNEFIVEYPFRELQPGPYEATLKARNAFGWSLESEPHTFTGGAYIISSDIYVNQCKSYIFLSDIVFSLAQYFPVSTSNQVKNIIC